MSENTEIYRISMILLWWYIYSMIPYPDEYKRLALAHSVFSFPDTEDWVPHWARALLQYLINLFKTDQKPGQASPCCLSVS